MCFVLAAACPAFGQIPPSGGGGSAFASGSLHNHHVQALGSGVVGNAWGTVDYVMSTSLLSPGPQTYKVTVNATPAIGNTMSSQGWSVGAGATHFGNLTSGSVVIHGPVPIFSDVEVSVYDTVIGDWLPLVVNSTFKNVHP